MCTCGIAIATQQANAGEAENDGERVGADADIHARLRIAVSVCRSVPRMLARRISSNSAIASRAEKADGDVRRAPAVHRRAALDDRRPDRAGEIVAAGGDGHRDAAPAHEPVRRFRHQRREGRRRAETDQHMDDRELPQRGRKARADIAAQQRRDADGDRRQNAEPVRRAGR